MPVIAQAPVVFSSMTSAAGTSEQIFQVNSSGVTAGLKSGNFYLNAPNSNVLNGVPFTVKLGGWIKAHGTSQYVGIGLLWDSWISGSQTGSPADTYTVVQSAALTAGTYYDFYVEQKFFGEANANTLTALAPTVYVGGAAVSIVSVTSPLTVQFNTASQTEPITGINNTQDSPLVSFAASFKNTTSDTTMTLALTTFNLSI